MAKMQRREVLKAGVVGAISVTMTGVSPGEEIKPMAKQKEPRVTPFLAFKGNAEEAIKRYVAIIENSKIVSIEHYGPGEVGKDGSVKIAECTLNGQRLLCIDVPGEHEWTFTPAVSLYIESSDEVALTKYYESLSKKGKILMPLDEYPFSKKFAWVQDEIGVSWQLNAS